MHVVNRRTRVALQIVVAPSCPGGDVARRLAQEAARRFPAVQVELIELDGQREPPEGVVATPTYLLNGRVTWLGNPYPEDLFHRLALCQTAVGGPIGGPRHGEDA